MKTHHHKSSALIGVLCGLILSFTLSVAQAAETYWINTGTGAWEDIGNWSNGVPDDDDTAYIQNSGTVILSSGTGKVFTIDVGKNNVGSGSFIIKGTGFLDTTKQSGEIRVGSSVSGAGVLILTDSGTINGNWACIGSYGYGLDFPVVGMATVSGSAFWTTHGDDMYVGYYGAGSMGTLTLTDSGSMYSGWTHLGYALNTKGVAIVSGSARWDIGMDYGGEFYVGENGTGSLTITDSGRVNNGDVVYLGYGSESSGTATVSGSAVWDNNDNDFVVGNSGNGTLNLNGGTLVVNSLVLGQNTGSEGVLEIGGDGSGKILLTEGDDDSAADIYGGDGNGTVRFTHSGTATFRNYIDGSRIVLEHNGPGTTILTGSVYVCYVDVSGGTLRVEGYLGAIENITVRDGTRLSGEGGYVYSDGGINISSGAILEAGVQLDGYTVNIGDIVLVMSGDYRLNIYGEELFIDGEVTVDFSGVTLEADQSYVVIDWSGVNTVSTDGGQFSATGLGEGLEGSFEVQDGQLTFNATAVPEPSTWFLIGAGLGALALIRRRSS
jgi:T5SS/PEP-CTERM-associated repeat protein